MEFIKNNWMKIVMATMTLAGAVLFIILLAQYSPSHHNNLTHPLLPESVDDPNNAMSHLFGHIAGLTFFVLATAFLVISMFTSTKKYNKFVLCSVGVLCTVFMVISIVGAITSENSRFARSVMNGEHDANITAAVQVAVRAEMFAEGGAAHDLAPILTSVAVENWVATLVGAANASLIPMTPEVAEVTGQTLVAGFNNAVAENSTIQIRDAQNAASYQFFSRIVTLVTQLIIFGLMPLTFGLKKIFCNRSCTSA